LSKNKFLSVKNNFFLDRIVQQRYDDDRTDLAHHLLGQDIEPKIQRIFEDKMIQNLKQNQTYNCRNNRYRNEVSKFPLFRMLSSFENKPDAEEIIGDNATSGRQYITERIFDPIKIVFRRINLWEINAQYFKTADFHNGAQAAGDDEKKNLFMSK
jgi:hypothetical protein